MLLLFRLLAAFLILVPLALQAASDVDVLIYGATPAGIAAALAAAEDGEKVLLVEPTDRIGGMLTNGLSHTDFHSFESITGFFLRFSRAVVEAYRPEFGEQAEAVSFRGLHAEPKMNLAVLEKMLAAQPGITVQREWDLEAVAASTEADVDRPGTMRSLEVGLFADEKGERHSVPARYFIDATYEGDLLAAAGVPYQVGREGKAEYGETLAPEQADTELQAYNLRLIMTREEANRVPVRAPAEYDREEFAGVLPLIEQGKITSAFGPDPKSIYKAQMPYLPHLKVDINDMSRGLVRLSRPGHNDGWPDGGGGVAIRGGATPALDAPPFSRVGLARTREAIMQEHLRWQVGMLYFLQNDAAVPETFRQEANTWGWCRDEFRENGHLPEQLYVREARRMQGMHLYTESDVKPEPGDVRAVLHPDSIASGDYGPNCHGTEHDGSDFGGAHTGEFYRPVPPYQIPYGVLVPRAVDNLLVVGAVSSSHVGFCTLRYEPIWASLGEAAGHAVHLARQERGPVQKVQVEKLQTRVRQSGSATIYLSDVPPGSPDFAPAQWWGTLGGFHGLATPSGKNGERGTKILGQYYEAYLNHAAALDKVLDPELANKWRKLADDLSIKVPIIKQDPPQTRGEWIRGAWEAAGKP